MRYFHQALMLGTCLTAPWNQARAVLWIPEAPPERYFDD